MSIQEKQFAHATALQEGLRALLEPALQTAGSAPNAILVPGGRTPVAVFEHFVHAPFAAGKSVHVGFTDERHVPHTAPESNYGAARPMLCALGVGGGRVLRVNTELDLEASAADYEQQWRAFFDQGGQISLALLGFGDDGHTCSLFTGDDLERSTGRLAIPVTRPNPPHRISVTPELLARAARVILAGAGPEKVPVVRGLLEQPETVVAGRAVANCAHVELWHA